MIRMGVLILLMLAELSFSNTAEAATAVSVTDFQNKVGSVSCGQDWAWWQDNLGSAFRDMLITELGKNQNLEVYERENLRTIYDQEVNLMNSEKTKELPRGHFKKAKYTFVGAVSSYSYCAEKTGGSVSVGRLAGLLGVGAGFGAVSEALPDISIGKGSAKVVIDLRLIETATGRIVKSVKAEGQASRNNYKVENSIASFGQAKETPVGEAARDAISKAVQELAGAGVI